MKFIRDPEISTYLVHVTLNNRKGYKGVCCSLTTDTASNSFRGLFFSAIRKQKICCHWEVIQIKCMSLKRLDGLFLVDRYELGRSRGWNLPALKQRRGRQHGTGQATPWAIKVQYSHVEETGIEGLVLPESSLVDKAACPHLMDTV